MVETAFYSPYAHPKAPMTRFRQLLVCAVLLAAAGAGYFLFSGGTEETGTTAQGPAGQSRGIAGLGGPGGSVNVITAKVSSDDGGATVTSLGTAKAARSVAVTPQITGIVAEVAFEPGSRVEEGQVLVRLEDEEQQVAVDRARVSLAQAQDTLERSQTLATSRTISNVALTEAETALQMAEIEVRSAQVDLDRRTVKAPFSGVAGLTDVVPGNLVTTSAEIVRIEDVSTIKVGFEVPERWTGRIVPGLPISATAEGVPGQDFGGEVTAVDSRVDETTRTLRMEATLGNEDGLIKPGMAIVVRIDFDNQEQLSVPSLALQWDRSGSFVWRFADDKVTRVPVTVLSRRSGAVVVKADLAPGDSVVVEGVQRLREGMKATLVGEAPEQTGIDEGGAASPSAEPALSRTETPPARS